MIAYLGFVFIKAVLGLIQALPLPTALRLARAAARVGWRLDSYHRRLVRRNVRLAFESQEETLIARESFFRFVENAAAAAWMAGRADAEIHPWIELRNVEQNLLPAIARNRGVIHVMFHLGNWEALARIVSRIPQAKFSTLYQPLQNPHFDALVRQWRERGGVGLINRHHGFAEAVKRLRRGEAVGMLVDQHAGDHGMWIPFFDRLASTTPLPAVLARRTGATIVPIFCTDLLGSKSKKPSPRWRIEFGEPVPSEGRSDGEIMMDVHRRLEAAIRQDPAGWFWLHNRWKTPSPNVLFGGYRRGVYVPPGTRLKPFRTLARSANWLGDAVLTEPALRAIREGRPDCHVTLLAPPKLRDLWKGQPSVDTVVTSLRELRSLKTSFEVAILFPNSLRSALEAWFLGVPRRFGYAGHGGRRFFLTAICPETYRAGVREHDVKDFAGLARWMGGEVRNPIPSWRVPSQASPKPYVLLHPGAAHGSAKRWLPERFVELVRLFPDLHWRLIGSADEKIRNAELARRMGHGIVDGTGRENLADLAALLAGAQAVVCNDSGPMHLAAAVGTPLVAIFGSSEPLHTGPLGTSGQKIRILRRIVECSPCYRKECPVDLRCMKAVHVEEVAAALREALG